MDRFGIGLCVSVKYTHFHIIFFHNYSDCVVPPPFCSFLSSQCTRLRLTHIPLFFLLFTVLMFVPSTNLASTRLARTIYIVVLNVHTRLPISMIFCIAEHIMGTSWAPRRTIFHSV